MESRISAEIQPALGKAQPAALALERLGFRVLHIGPTISADGPASLWSRIFEVDFELPSESKKSGTAIPSLHPKVRALTNQMRIPPELKELVVDVIFPEPPEFY